MRHFTADPGVRGRAGGARWGYMDLPAWPTHGPDGGKEVLLGALRSPTTPPLIASDGRSYGDPGTSGAASPANSSRRTKSQGRSMPSSLARRALGQLLA